MAVVEISDATFAAEVLESSLPVLIDLYTPTCGPCRTLAPIVAEVADEVAGRAKVAKCDVSRNPQVAQMFQVSQVPFLVVLKGGNVVGHQLGLVPKQALLKLLEPHMEQDQAAVGAKELADLIAAGKALPVDIRDSGSFGRYRIPGAIHIDQDALASSHDALQPEDGRRPVLYGRADEAHAAARALADAGLAVAYLKDGFLGWEGEELEVERG